MNRLVDSAELALADLLFDVVLGVDLLLSRRHDSRIERKSQIVVHLCAR